MMEANKQHKKEQAPAHAYEMAEWSALSDTQKAQLLLGSTRLLDSECFLLKFGSFEQPTLLNNLKIKGNEQVH